MVGAEAIDLSGVDPPRFRAALRRRLVGGLS
jgi:hypothetical protein